MRIQMSVSILGLRPDLERSVERSRDEPFAVRTDVHAHDLRVVALQRAQRLPALSRPELQTI